MGLIAVRCLSANRVISDVSSFRRRTSVGGEILRVSKLSAEILYQASRCLRCNGYRYGPIFYRYSAFSLSLYSAGGAAIALGGNPNHYFNPISSDVLMKRPILPFVEQDEWRIAVFTDGYLGSDAALPLKINVSTDNFYPYLKPDGS